MFINRAQYYDAFSEYDLTGKVKKMEEIVYKALLNSFHKRLAYLAGKKIIFSNIILNSDFPHAFF
jgi:hypothetical protein